MQPLVSIVIPTFNRAHLIGETLDSVIAQTYQNWECIVVDDGSVDYTEKLIEFYSQKDSRIQFFHRPNHKQKGANSCRNYGFELCKGELIQWLDSDDILSTRKLEVQVEDLKEKGSTAVSICKFGYFKSATENISTRENISTYKSFERGKDLLLCFGKYGEYLPLHAYLIRRELVWKASKWDESLVVNQDGEFFCRILLIARPIQFSKTEVFYRIGGKENVSLLNNPLKVQRVIDSWKMIQNHLKNEKHPYVEQAKKMLHQKLRHTYPEVIEKNYKFFKSTMPFYKRLIKKLF